MEKSLGNEQWRKQLRIINVIIVFATVVLELITFFMLGNSSLRGDELKRYLQEYMLEPVLLNLIFCVIGNVVSMKAEDEFFKNLAPILGLTCICGVITVVHNVFFVTMLIFAVPLFLSAFFQSKKIVNIVLVYSIIFLMVEVVYCFTVTYKSREDAYFIPSIVIAACILVAVRAITCKMIDVLAYQSERLVGMAEEAKAANKAKSDFLSVVSHELRTPMNAVVGMTDLMLQEELNEQQMMYLKNIKTSGSTLVMIVNDLLDQAKIESGKMDLLLRPYELSSMLDDIRLIIENRIGEKPIELDYEIDEKVPNQLVGDALRIRQILINLMNNAVKYTNKGKISISIKLEQLKKREVSLRFGVRDTGQGIKKEDLNRLFEAFTQVNTEENHMKEGTGLGLMISKDLVSLMGGQLEVQSEVGVGSEFFFTITQGIPTEEEKKEQDEKFIDYSDKKLKVLVVDDTNVNLLVAKGLFSKLGIQIDIADSGMKALEKLEEKEYNMVFLDYMMPEMDGVQTAEVIRSRAVDAETAGDKKVAEYYTKIPIIALTGASDEKTKDRFGEAGVNDIIIKPIREKDIRRVIGKWISE